ncbi:MAG: DUF2075 domain-containing protein [Candidatus Electrothrix sp. AR3]|nr:DUF2075 domain-containing protein [Candidatus Electrothrix sp. AR3]
MALRIIEGVPGSGKTYYAVKHLAKNYFKYNKQIDLYEKTKECTLITNIDEFKPHHLNLKEEISKAGSIATFFSYKYQEQYKEGKPQIIYIIDEAQRFFRKGDKGLNEVYSYFEYHRHWGQDVYLVTQNARKLPPDLVYLVEYLIKALPRTRSMMGEFKYHWISSGEKIKTETLRPDQGVFALYKSMDIGESEKIKNPVMAKIGKAFLFAFLAAYGGYKFIMHRWGGDETPASPPSISSPAPLGNSTISVGKATAPTETRQYFVFQPIIHVVRKNKLKLYAPSVGTFIPVEAYPYEVVHKGNQFYAVYDYEHFSMLYPDEEQRPADVIILPEERI